jgi:ArsR family transcriptional regulator, arsenate/arsenite/antimonite-responsive transcriptional repressor
MIRARRDRAVQFHGLADRTRLRVLELLRPGERCVCELTEALEVGQSLLSFHLKALKRAGLVRDRREGRWTYYSLDEDRLRDMAAVLTALADRPRRTRGGRRCD